MNFKTYNYRFLVIVAILFMAHNHVVSQSETSKWKFQIAFGLNFPEASGFQSPYAPKIPGFPSINLGVQRMFTETLGGKVDFAYNRMRHADNSPDFKNNYTRFNLQFVYDATSKLNFLPPKIGLVGHLGPGISFTKPLGNLTQNKKTFLNVLAGFEVHYSITDAVSAFVDTSYIYSFSGDKVYNPVTTGFGAFRGNLLTVLVGVSVSLSGCYYCD